MTTFTEYQKLSNDRQEQALFETIFTYNELAPYLQLEPSDGNAHSYDREATNPAAATIDDEVTGGFTETNPTFNEYTATLKTVYVQSPMNNKTQALARVRDPLAVLKFGMMKSFSRKLMDLIVNGDSSVDPNAFDGLTKTALSETRMMAMDSGDMTGPGTAETELTVDRLHELIDSVEGGGVDCLIMNKTMRRKLTSLMYAAGGGIELPSVEMFGRRVRTFDEIPICVSDWVGNAEQYDDAATWPASTATSIYAVRFGHARDGGYTIIHNGPVFNAQFTDLGNRITNNDHVWRLISYIGAYLPTPESMAVLGGIDSTA